MKTFFVWLADILLASLLGTLGRLAKELYDRLTSREDIKKDAEASVEPLKQATNGEEVDKATDPALNGY